MTRYFIVSDEHADKAWPELRDEIIKEITRLRDEAIQRQRQASDRPRSQQFISARGQKYVLQDLLFYLADSRVMTQEQYEALVHPHGA